MHSKAIIFAAACAGFFGAGRKLTTTRRAFTALALAGVVWMSSGCATEHAAALKLTGDPIVDGQNAIEHGPARDKLLWQYRVALAAMRRGQFDLAKRNLD